MERIDKSIDVDAPLRAVYNQWTQFEKFPRFMAGVREVRQLDDTQEWDAEITEQEPDTRISWKSISGTESAGTGLNEQQAIVLIDGYVDGLRGGEKLTEERITAFLDDPLAIAGMKMPLDMSLAERRLFKRGALGGLRLAAQGYWMDTADTSGGHTLH